MTSKNIFKSISFRVIVIYFLALLVGLIMIAFTGNKSFKPHLGIDLQGGTIVTLTPRTSSGKPPSAEQLKQAQNIIESRVNGRGITGASVVVTGTNIAITIPGNDQGLARSLGTTAQLFIRPVLSSRPANLPKTPTPPKPPVPNTPASKPPAPGAPGANSSAGKPNSPVLSTEQELAKSIDEAKSTRQSNVQATETKTFTDFSCNADDPLRGNDDPKLPLVTCSQDGQNVYLLGPSILSGTDITNATSNQNQYGQTVVDVEFNSAGASTWANYTTKNIGKSVAIVLDTQVLSAPQIQSAIIGGNTEITGKFSQLEAQNLANELKYGGLPLSFSVGQAQTISATLGFSSLKAGLIAGIIGLTLVLLYGLIYYRILGFLVAFSLIISLGTIYEIFVLLGRSIGLSLDLPGIAGLIIGIGMTADSFVVYFERIKDDVRTGKSFRSAVQSGWAKARRTILTGNAVSFIAAAVLYILAVGDVKGFAFTLGLTSVIDALIVFMVTHPILEFISKNEFANKNKSLFGLGKKVGEN